MNDDRCTYDGCTRKRVGKRGYCQRHRTQLLDEGALPRVQVSREGDCVAAGCEKPVQSKGMCDVHYWRQRKYGSLDLPEQGPPKSCSVEDCEKPPTGRGLCNAHYHRWARSQPIENLHSEEIYAAFLSRVDNSGGPDACWPWIGHRSRAGYGVFNIKRRQVKPTRWILGYLRGKPLVADEWALHHCDNPPCCNPAHLYVGDVQRNVADMHERGRDRNVLADRNASKTHCAKGHPYVGDNLQVVTTTGYRQCRACAQVNDKKRRDREKAERLAARSTPASA